MLRRFAISTIALTAILCAASAEPGITKGSNTVSYADLDLNTPSGARAMLNRIERASTEACGRSPYLRNPYSPALGYLMSDYRQCREQAIAQAVASLRAPAVSRLYAESRAAQPGRLAGR
jgi:UrcA family protein